MHLCLSCFTFLISIRTVRLYLRTSDPIPFWTCICFTVTCTCGDQSFPFTFRLSDLFTSNFNRFYSILHFFSKVTNFYRKSFGDYLLPMVAHGTTGSRWLPPATAGVTLNSDPVEKWLPGQFLTDWGSIFNVKKRLPPFFNDSPTHKKLTPLKIDPRWRVII